MLASIVDYSHTVLIGRKVGTGSSLAHRPPSLRSAPSWPQGSLKFLTCSSPFLTQPYQPWVATSPPPFPGTITALLADAMNAVARDPCPARTCSAQIETASGREPSLRPSGNCSPCMPVGTLPSLSSVQAAKLKPCELPANISHL